MKFRDLGRRDEKGREDIREGKTIEKKKSQMKNERREEREE